MNHRTVRLDPGLYLVATPIGTARDITLRALDILASAEVLAAEDTRAARRLLEIHGVPLGGRPLIAYHDHSAAGVRARLMERLAEGQSVAYASEAGTPLIADPGFDLVREAAAAGHLVTAAPGPSAAIAALSLAGLPTDAFFFGGFLPSARGARRARLEALREIPGTLVLYESPNRVAASLKDCAEVLGGGREAALCRELTKKFEEVRRGSLAELAEGAEADGVRGEVVLLIDRAGAAAADAGSVEADLVKALEGFSLKDASEMVAKAHGLPRRQVYQMALKRAKGD